jgi:hypothetical protein
LIKMAVVLCSASSAACASLKRLPKVANTLD